MEKHLFSLGFLEQSPCVSTDDLTRLSLYEQRFNRTLVQAKAEPKQLQQERRHALRQGPTGL